MKLFLCGGGSGKQIINAYNKFYSIIDHNKPILYIPLAMDEKKYDGCFEWFSNEIKNINIKSFDMVRSSKELSEKNFNDYSALFIGGGNTFKLLKEIKENNNYEKIIKYIKEDGVVFGGSAGSIIFGKSIYSCINDDKNKVNLKNYEGFNLLNNYSILCHLNKKNFKKNKEHLLNLSHNYKIIYLPEEDVIFINNNIIHFYGKEKYYIFNNNKYYLHNFSNIKRDLNI